MLARLLKKQLAFFMELYFQLSIQCKHHQTSFGRLVQLVSYSYLFVFMLFDILDGLKY